MEKKITMVDGVIMIVSALFVDLIALFFFVSVILAIFGLILIIIYSFAIQLWMFMKGIRGPLVVRLNAIPIKIVSVIAMIIMINNPKIQKIASVAKGGMGGGTSGAPRGKIITRYEKQADGSMIKTI